MKREQIKLLRGLVRSLSVLTKAYKSQAENVRDVTINDLKTISSTLAILQKRFDNLAQIWEEK